jgi:hypothetical protein
LGHFILATETDPRTTAVRATGIATLRRITATVGNICFCELAARHKKRTGRVILLAAIAPTRNQLINY